MKVVQMKLESAYDIERNKHMQQLKVIFDDGTCSILVAQMFQEAAFLADGLSQLSDAVALHAGARA